MANEKTRKDAIAISSMAHRTTDRLLRRPPQGDTKTAAHNEAANAHKQAAGLARSSGNAKAALHHDELARLHQTMAASPHGSSQYRDAENAAESRTRNTPHAAVWPKAGAVSASQPATALDFHARSDEARTASQHADMMGKHAGAKPSEGSHMQAAEHHRKAASAHEQAASAAKAERAKAPSYYDQKAAEHQAAADKHHAAANAHEGSMDAEIHRQVDKRDARDAARDARASKLMAFRDKGAPERSLQQGAKGGQYYLTESGQKVYVRK